MGKIKKISLCLVSFLICFIIGEGCFRIYHCHKYSIPLKEGLLYGSHTRKNHQFYVFDKTLGWKNIENENYGFQAFGDTSSTKKKVLIIGDSFTRAVQIDPNKTYYSYLSTLPIELFVYGVDGYGTLQEYLVLEKYFDLINPDIVIIQLCWNDFVENSIEFGTKSHLNINKIKRPYLMDDATITYKDPSRDNLIIFFANHYSKLLRFVLSRTRLFSYNIEQEIQLKGPEHPVFQKASDITSSIFAMISQRCSNLPVIVFAVGDTQPYYQEFKKISKKHNFIFLENIAGSMKNAKEQGVAIKLHDMAHWNEQGHKIAGREIISFLKKAFML